MSLELRPGEVTEHADVVLPVAAVAEKAGTFLNWEGRVRFFEAALKPDQMTRRLAPTDARVLQMLADAMDVHLGLPDLRTTRGELDRLGPWGGLRATGPVEIAASLPRPAAGRPCSRATGCCSTRAASRRATTRSPGPGMPHARVSAATAAEAGVKEGDLLAVTSSAGTVELPLQITEMPDRVVWLPLNSTGGASPPTRGRCPAHSSASARRRSSARPQGGGGMSSLYLATEDLSMFGRDPWWLVVVKAVFCFAFLMITVLFSIVWERKVVAWMQLRIGPNRHGPGACSSRSPTA